MATALRHFQSVASYGETPDLITSFSGGPPSPLLSGREFPREIAGERPGALILSPAKAVLLPLENFLHQ